MPRDTSKPARLKEAELERASWRRRTLLLEVTRGGWHEKEETNGCKYDIYIGYIYKKYGHA